MIGLLHAYSRSNAGDGLLVDLSLERLRRAGVDKDDVLLVALDPDSFADHAHRMGVGTRGRGVSRKLLPATAGAIRLCASAVSRRRIGEAAEALARCDGLVAVGGGYLRSPDAVSSVGVTLNHIPQLLLAARRSAPAIYLPQSVGPLRGPAGMVIKRGLAHIEAICVRDQSSEAELSGMQGLRRIPDLAVLDVAECWDEVDRSSVGHEVGLVARQVGHAAGYETALRNLAGHLGERAVWSVQTEGDPTKSDAVHYQRLGVDSAGGLASMLARQRLAVVVSVRLHGALMALRQGVPAIHLAYDRKGPAAFADLGLDDWWFDVRQLDAQKLIAKVDQLLASPQVYWKAVGERVADLRARSAELDKLVHQTVHPTRGSMQG